MVVNPWKVRSMKIKPIGFGVVKSAKAKKRTLSLRDRQILHEDIAKGKCHQCGKKISFSEMQAGHKTAYSKGGSTTLRNSVALCYSCNKKQGTDSYSKFSRKTGKIKVTRKRTVVKKRPKETGPINPFTRKAYKY